MNSPQQPPTRTMSTSASYATHHVHQNAVPQSGQYLNSTTSQWQPIPRLPSRARPHITSAFAVHTGTYYSRHANATGALGSGSSAYAYEDAWLKSLPQPMDVYTLTDSNVAIHNCTVYDSQRKAVYKISSKQLAETAIVRIREARNPATNLAEISFPWTKDITYRDETLSRPSFSIRIPCIDPNSLFKHASVWMPRADLSERRDGRALHTSVRSEDAYESLTHSCIGLDIWTYLLQRDPSRQFGTNYTDRTQTMAGAGR